jgi:tetratricopeptide (TPR) repeat protein
LAWFGKKKDDEKEPKAAAGGANGTGAGTGTGDGGGDGGEPLDFTPDPDKAAKWFERAQAVHETTNYEYAMQCWLQGLRLDPTSMRGLESFFKSAASFLSENDSKGPSKDTLKMFGGRGAVERFLSALLAWGTRPLDALLAVRATEAAANLKLTEQTHWIGERALHAVANEKKPRRDLFIKLMAAFSEIGDFRLAVVAGDAAVRLDPSDGRLAADVRNLSAQATMSEGGYDLSGQAGGFRQNIRDAEKQRHLEEQERIVKTEETLDRVVRANEEEYKSRPDDPASTLKYAKSLMERGRPEDERKALEVLKRGFEVTKQFRFRELQGDLILRRAARKLAQYRDSAAAAPENSKAQTQYKAAQTEYLRMEIEEFKGRVAAYPTDLSLKFELGRRLFESGNTDGAIALFQESQHDAKRRVDSLNYLGEAFMKIGWIDEAVHTFRQAMEGYKVATDETGMGLRFGLLSALQAKAEAERDLAVAEEADRLASAIAVQQFNYRDIRVRRDALKKLIGELKRGDPVT